MWNLLETKVDNERMQPSAVTCEPCSLVPSFAPLSASMIIQALVTQEGKKQRDEPGIDLYQRQPPELLPSWERLYQRFKPARHDAYTLTQQALQRGTFSTRW